MSSRSLMFVSVNGTAQSYGQQAGGSVASRPLLLARHRSGSFSRLSSYSVGLRLPSPMLHRDQKVEEMRRVPLFSGCSKGELRQIARLADEIDVPAGKVLTEQGMPGREFFILVDGTVNVARDGKLIDTLGAGEFFGETALISDRPRNATVTASTPLRALVISERDFYGLLIDTPRIQWKVLRALADRLAPRETV